MRATRSSPGPERSFVEPRPVARDQERLAGAGPLLGQRGRGSAQAGGRARAARCRGSAGCHPSGSTAAAARRPRPRGRRAPGPRRRASRRAPRWPTAGDADEVAVLARLVHAVRGRHHDARRDQRARARRKPRRRSISMKASGAAKASLTWSCRRRSRRPRGENGRDDEPHEQHDEADGRARYVAAETHHDLRSAAGARALSASAQATRPFQHRSRSRSALGFRRARRAAARGTRARPDCP